MDTVYPTNTIGTVTAAGIDMTTAAYTAANWAHASLDAVIYNPPVFTY